MEFNSKTTKREILHAYNDLKKQLEVLQNNPSIAEVRDIPELVAGLEKLHGASATLMGSQDHETAQLIAKVKKLKTETDTRCAELDSNYALCVNSEQDFFDLLEEYRLDEAEHNLQLNRKLEEHAKILGDKRQEGAKACAELHAVILDTVAEHGKILNRVKDEFRYEKGKCEQDDKIESNARMKAVQQEVADLESEFSEFKKTEQKLVSDRIEVCEDLKTELEEARRRSHAEESKALGKGAGRAKREGEYSFAKYTTEAKSLVAQKRSAVDAALSQVERHEKIREDLTRRLDRVAEDIQALSKASIHANTNGSAMALNAVEKIAMEQARTSVNSKR